MTSTTQPNAARAGEIAQHIVALLIDVDSETRQRAIHAAMMLLGEARPSGAERGMHEEHERHDEHHDLAHFFDRAEKFKPAEYAQLCAAYHYSRYGPSAFTLEEIRSIAAEAGVVLPDRLDKTFGSAAHAGKKLFQSTGRGTFKPTATAGIAFNERWSVKPGRQSKSAAMPEGRNTQ